MLRRQNVIQADQFSKDHRPRVGLNINHERSLSSKKDFVNPGSALSLQSHHHRSEHWIVVKGTAKVTIDSKIKMVSEGQSVYIPLGAKHRLENPGKIPMVLIEVQTGSYLGEDDITRYEDLYQRNRIIE